MKLSHLPRVLDMVGQRRQLVDFLDAAAERKLAVSIDSNRQDETIVALVLPVIACELNARIAKIDRELEAHGVQIA
jgi:hypothetical protein